MHPSLVIILICLVVASASAGPYFLEIYPDTWLKGDEDEYITIGWDHAYDTISLSDGEGTIMISPQNPGPSSCTIARNATAYHQVWGAYPDFEIIDSTPLVPQVAGEGRFQLSNKKDELTLISGSTSYDSITWPGTFTPRQGQIHTRSPNGRWDERVLMAGGTKLVPQTFQNVSGIAFVSPDCSRQVLEQTIRNAQTSILLNVYEFTDPGIAQLAADAKARGVAVRLLLEGGPVGGIPAEEYPIIYQLIQTGIDVRVMESTDDAHTPYRYNHAKYLIVDGTRVLVTTENFKEHSFPFAGYSGNRGWGVILESSQLASYFTHVFEDDWDGPGVSTVHDGRPGAGEEPVTNPYHPLFEPLHFTDAEVTPVFSPDTSMLIADMINQSQERVWIEQAYIKDYQTHNTNPFLEAAINAARRGVDVRILLDGYYYNIEGDDDNDEMVTRLMTVAARENIPLKAHLLYPEKTELLKVHTKGVIADNQVLISSMNWNENSACFNREAGVIITNPQAASYYASVFLQDWAGKPSTKQNSRANQEDKTRFIQMISLAGVVIILIVTYRRYNR